MAVQPWEAVLGGALAVAIMVLWWPRVRASLRDSPRAGWAQWRDALLPLALVVGFVLLLIAML